MLCYSKAALHQSGQCSSCLSVINADPFWGVWFWRSFILHGNRLNLYEKIKHCVASSSSRTVHTHTHTMCICRLQQEAVSFSRPLGPQQVLWGSCLRFAQSPVTKHGFYQDKQPPRNQFQFLLVVVVVFSPKTRGKCASVAGTLLNDYTLQMDVVQHCAIQFAPFPLSRAAVWTENVIVPSQERAPRLRLS